MDSSTCKCWLVYEKNELGVFNVVDLLFAEAEAWNWQYRNKPFFIVESQFLRGLEIVV